MAYIFLDFETQSQLSLPAVGPYVYAKHHSTKILCAAWTMNHCPVVATDDFATTYRMNKLDRPEYTFVAHNIEFERNLLKHKLGLDIPLRRWQDTAAICARMGLPRSLEDAARALGVEHQKDVEGARVMMKLSRPRKVTPGKPITFWTPDDKPEDFKRLREYCMQDVEVMRQVFWALAPLDPEERMIWEMTLDMNERGVLIDVPSLVLARDLVSRVEDDLSQKFKLLVGHLPNSPKATEALGMESMDKYSVKNELKKPDLPLDKKLALQIRQKVAKSSVRKIEAMFDRVDRDNRLRGSLVYYGAERTGRWSSGGVQVQNLPRGLGKGTEAAFQALSHNALDLVYDDVLATVSDMLRGFLVGPFMVGDFSQVEARVTAWVADQLDLLNIFANGEDPYKRMAAAVYQVPLDKVTKDQRFMGKQAILGCGFGMGAEKFQRMLDETYDVQVDRSFAERVISIYRRSYPRIVATWYKLNDAIRWVASGTMPSCRVGKVLVGRRGKFMYIQLPSLRDIYYHMPEYSMDRVTYLGRNPYKGGTWERVETWGGKILENIVQATSRDLLANAMLRLKGEGYNLVLTVHDEVVVDAKGDLPAFERHMRAVPSWAKGLPVDVECFECARYQK